MDIALITGASSGMGKEFVKLIDNEGCDELWLVARRKEALEAIARECRTPARVFALDLLRDESIDALLAAVRENDCRVTWLVNSAGFGVFGENGRQPLAVQNAMIDLNVTATVRMCNDFAQFMPRGAHIINLGSASVFNPLPYFNVYASTKAFILHYSRGLAEEMKPRGVTVSVLCPGWVRTEFFDHVRDETERSPREYRPMVEPDDVVRYCMKNAKKGKVVIVHGWYTKLQHLFSKVFPRRLLIRLWLGMLDEPKK